MSFEGDPETQMRNATAGTLHAALGVPKQRSRKAVLTLLLTHGKCKKINLFCFNPLSLWQFVHSNRRLISYLELISAALFLLGSFLFLITVAKATLDCINHDNARRTGGTVLQYSLLRV